jgi:osmotically-inducible protein OsmY
MRLILALIAATVLAGNLAGCVPVVAGGAAAGGLMAADRRTSGAYIDDQAIELKASKQINDQLDTRVHADITSYNRNVLITGEAYDDAAKQKAESIVKGIENVRSVTNEMIIGPQSSMSSRSNDAYLTSKVKARMVSENKFPANYVKVITEQGVVYLMGMVTRQEAEDAVEIARNTDGVDKVVKVFEYVVVE